MVNNECCNFDYTSVDDGNLGIIRDILQGNI